MSRVSSAVWTVLVALSLAACATTGNGGGGAGGGRLQQEIAGFLTPEQLEAAKAAEQATDVTFAADDRDLVPVVVEKDDPAWGPATAPVTLVVFSDFQCPYCARHAVNVRDLKAKYGDLLRVVFKQYPLPFHKQAMPAAVASLVAHEQGKFWEMHDMLFQRRAMTDEETMAWAAQHGLDLEKLAKASEDTRYRERVRADMKAGEAYGVRGTPSSFVNGVMVRGAVPLDKLDQQVQLGLARAWVLLDKGVAPKDLYPRLVGLKKK